MNWNFEYLYQQTAMDSIDIEDIGNCSLLVLNDMAEEWLINVETDLGWTTVIQFGPILADTNELIHGRAFSFSKYQLEYNENKIIKAIDKILVDDKKSITQAEEISKDDFYDIWEYVKEEL